MERGNYAASASSSPLSDGVLPSPASQPSSFAPSPFCCSRVGRLRFKGDSILFQRQMCYPLLCVVSLSARTKCSRSRSLGCSGEKATVARALARQPPTPPRSQPQIKVVLHFCSVSPSQCLAFTARAQLSMLNAVRIANTLLSKMQD